MCTERYSTLLDDFHLFVIFFFIFCARNISPCMVLMLILWLEKFSKLKEFCDILVKVMPDIMYAVC